MANQIVKNNGVKKSLVRDTRGITTTETVIVLCLIALVGIAAWTKFGAAVKGKAVAAQGAVDKLPTQ